MQNHINNSGTDPNSMLLSLDDGKLVHHPGRKGKMILCDRTVDCLSQTFDQNSEFGKCAM